MLTSTLSPKENVFLFLNIGVSKIAMMTQSFSSISTADNNFLILYK